LAKAAEALGRGEDLSPLALQGPTEVRDLTSAFNHMQERLTRFVSDRTRILAAVGHDLRSPLTALRVRVELVDDEETRTSLITSIEEMQSMVEATLTFARSLAAQEELTTVSVSEFLARLQDDMVEVFEIFGGPDVTIHLRQNAMRPSWSRTMVRAFPKRNSIASSTHSTDLKDRGRWRPAATGSAFRSRVLSSGGTAATLRCRTGLRADWT
jgi:signal transduction histidine kinase